MKNSILVIMVLGLITVVGCDQRADVKSMMDNQETRNEIFDSMISNPQYMASFKEYLQDHKGASQMMMGNSMNGRKGMNGMNGMNGGKGMGMNMKDSTAMMHSFMNNQKMMTLMLQNMKDEGMMNEECMNHAMQTMNRNMNKKQ